jgi:hypothetical protein
VREEGENKDKDMKEEKDMISRKVIAWPEEIEEFIDYWSSKKSGLEKEPHAHNNDCLYLG